MCTAITVSMPQLFKSSKRRPAFTALIDRTSCTKPDRESMLLKPWEWNSESEINVLVFESPDDRLVIASAPLGPQPLRSMDFRHGNLGNTCANTSQPSGVPSAEFGIPSEWSLPRHSVSNVPSDASPGPNA